MVGSADSLSSNVVSSSSQSSSNHSSSSYSSGNDSQWGWSRPRSSSMRSSNYMSGPRRSPYMRPVFYPGPRGPPPQQQSYYNQRKPRPNWMPRLVRLPHFPSSQSESNFNNYQQSNWSAPTPPPTPAAAPVKDETTTEPPATPASQTPEPALPSKKKKRIANGISRPWNKESAELALKTEMEFKKTAGFSALVIRFPDPILSKEIIQNFNTAIDNVHFQGPCSGRYCFVTLKDKANPEQVMEELNKTKFGCGYLTAERKVEKQEENVKPEDIDPFTLFVGNLPANISTLQVKEKFPAATRIDVGYAQKMKNTRYAFVRYLTTETALEAYKNSVNTIIGGRSIVLRFRRNNAPVGPPGEKPTTGTSEPAVGERLTVGAKLKAKKEKAKLEKALREREQGRVYKSEDDDSSDEDKISLEDDDSDSMGFNTDENDDMCEEDDDDDDDCDDGEEFEDDDDDDEEYDDYKMPTVDNDDDDDDDDDVDQDGVENDDLDLEDNNYKDDEGVLNDDPAMTDTDFLTKLMKHKPK